MLTYISEQTLTAWNVNSVLKKYLFRQSSPVVKHYSNQNNRHHHWFTSVLIILPQVCNNPLSVNILSCKPTFFIVQLLTCVFNCAFFKFWWPANYSFPKWYNDFQLGRPFEPNLDLVFLLLCNSTSRCGVLCTFSWLIVNARNVRRPITKSRVPALSGSTWTARLKAS